VTAAGCRAQPADTPAAPGPAPVTVTIRLPEGDVDAGRQAFQDLRCTTCHAVASEPDFPAPASATSGPLIDRRVAQRDVSYLITSIMMPSHAISLDTSADVRARLKGTLSPMGDFSHVMTVRQLVDLHAYIRSVR
jgi:hypothetical protein